MRDILRVIPGGRHLRPMALLDAWIDRAGIADGSCSAS